MIDSSNQFVIINEFKDINVEERLKDCEDGDCSGGYIDIYELYKVELNGCILLANNTTKLKIKLVNIVLIYE